MFARITRGKGLRCLEWVLGQDKHNVLLQDYQIICRLLQPKEWKGEFGEHKLIYKDDPSALCFLLLHRGAAFNTPDDTGRTPLFYTCSQGLIEISRKLLSLGADPLRHYDNTFSAMDFSNGNPTTQILLDSGCDIYAAPGSVEHEFSHSPVLGAIWADDHHKLACMLTHQPTNAHPKQGAGKSQLYQLLEDCCSYDRSRCFIYLIILDHDRVAAVLTEGVVRHFLHSLIYTVENDTRPFWVTFEDIDDIVDTIVVLLGFGGSQRPLLEVFSIWPGMQSILVVSPTLSPEKRHATRF
ncbi:hypothetical protein JX265_006069 [Neoarthrinium moseri]|uniref:Ankyrin repeat protein n=1 Tax=Neoarthrinium moseri TaxID=1658444 RepID=A0A9P9WMK9_9PEZI|nr:hypothetical protein JX265_006069 [Neoarthrinium moseri]